MLCKGRQRGKYWDNCDSIIKKIFFRLLPCDLIQCSVNIYFLSHWLLASWTAKNKRFQKDYGPVKDIYLHS